MRFFDNFIQKDKDLLVYLNGLGSEKWDFFWITVTNQLAWIPLYALFIYLIYKTFGTKKTVFLVFFVALLITFSDQFANLIKDWTARLRPNRDPQINQIIRILKNNKSFSFFSAHASTSTAVSTFMYLTLRNNFRYVGLFFIWPIIFAYSRIYLGVHFPTDILMGLFVGLVLGIVFYKMSIKLLNSKQLN